MIKNFLPQINSEKNNALTDSIITKYSNLPLFIVSFSEFASRNCFYSDKTKIIESLENSGANNHVIHRPFGCGKSLTLSMLKCFYDTYYQDSYDNNFKDLYIYDKEIAKDIHNTYCVLFLDFGNCDNIANEIIRSISLFSSKYQMDYLPDTRKTLTQILNDFFNSYLRCKNNKLYIMIDNYDSYNPINPTDVFIKSTLTNEMYISFFMSIFKAQVNDIVTKVILTGVLPLYSYFQQCGINFYAQDISFTNDFSKSVGLTENDIKSVILHTVNQKDTNHSFDDLTENICTELDGYSYTLNNIGRMINTRQCLIYLTSLKSNIQNESFEENYHYSKNCLEKAYLDFKKEFLYINKELSENGYFVTGTEFNLFSPNRIIQLTTFLYYCGILTFKESTKYNFNLRLTNTYISNIWKSIIK
ncbi:MAG: AAA family ATPase [Succinivibrionaceae bacterium]